MMSTRTITRLFAGAVVAIFLGNMSVVDAGADTIASASYGDGKVYFTNGGPASSAIAIPDSNRPFDVTQGPNGTVYATTPGGLYAYTLGGTQLWGAAGSSGAGVTVDGYGDVDVPQFTGGINRYNPTTGAYIDTISNAYNYAVIKTDSSGNLWVGAGGANSNPIEELTKNMSGGYNSTPVATIPGAASAHNFTFGPDGDIYASFISGTIEKFSPTDMATGTTFASGFLGGLTGIAVDPSGVVYVGEFYNGDVLKISANGLSSSVFTTVNYPDGISLVTPEPSTMMMAAIGAVGLFLAARRRRNRTVSGLFAGAVVAILLGNLGAVDALVSQASASPIAVGSVQTSTPWAVPGQELNLGIVPTTTGTVFGGTFGLGTTDDHALSNGTNGSGLADTDSIDSQANVAFIITGATVTFDLGSVQTIGSINTYTDWGFGRSEQVYSVFISNDNVTYAPLITGVTYNPPGVYNVDLDTRVTITDNASIVLTNARYVEFDFTAAQQNGASGWTELSINGVPEPSTMMMAAIGAVGLSLAARRRRR